MAILGKPKGVWIMTETRAAAPQPGAADKGRFTVARRQKVNVSIHPSTLSALTDLAVKFAVSRGVILDRAVAAIHAEVLTGTCHCAHNRPCPHSRGDVPEML